MEAPAKVMSRKITQRRPVVGVDEANSMYLVSIPWVETSGHPASPYEHNNGILAAIHSLLAAARMDEMKDVHFWLGEAQRQVNDAVLAAAKPYARPVPEPAKERLVLGSNLDGSL